MPDRDTRRRFTAYLLTALLLTACSPSDDGDQAAPAPTIETEAMPDPQSGTAEDLDEHARAACKEWSDSMDDFEANPDLDRLREASARITALAAPSDNDAVTEAAVTLQAGLTEDDMQRFEEGTAALTDACWPQDS